MTIRVFLILFFVVLIGTAASFAEGDFLPPGARYRIFTADRIEGRFHHPENRVVAEDGTRLRIEYGEGEINLVVESPGDS